MHFVFTNVTLIRIALMQYFLRKIFIVSIIFQGFPHRLLHNIIYIMLWRKLNCAHAPVFYWEDEHSEGTNDTLGGFLSCVPLSCGPLSSMSSVGLKDIYPIMKCLLYYWGMAKRKKSKKGREIERQRGISRRVMWTQASKFYQAQLSESLLFTGLPSSFSIILTVAQNHPLRIRNHYIKTDKLYKLSSFLPEKWLLPLNGTYCIQVRIGRVVYNFLATQVHFFYTKKGLIFCLFISGKLKHDQLSFIRKTFWEKFVCMPVDRNKAIKVSQL